MPALLLVAVAPSPRLSGTCRLLFLSLEHAIHSERVFCVVTSIASPVWHLPVVGPIPAERGFCVVISIASRVWHLPVGPIPGAHNSLRIINIAAENA